MDCEMLKSLETNSMPLNSWYFRGLNRDTNCRVNGWMLQVGETGRTVGVEHIPELVDRSIKAIKKTPAAYLMDGGNLVVHCTHFSFSHISMHSLLSMHFLNCHYNSPKSTLQSISKPSCRCTLLTMHLQNFRDLHCYHLSQCSQPHLK